MEEGMKMNKLLEETCKRSLDEEDFGEEIPNEETIEAMEEPLEECFTAEDAEQMITECLDGDTSWKNLK